MLAGIAVDKGSLHPGSLVSNYLPNLSNSAWMGATVRHLLDMTAGARFGDNYRDPDADLRKEAAVVGWKPQLVDRDTPKSLVGFARSGLSRPWFFKKASHVAEILRGSAETLWNFMSFFMAVIAH